MIPKIIHYCWFGPAVPGELIDRCITSWQKYCPTYVFMKWDEKTFDVTSHPFTKRMYEEKKYAFVADYVRLVAIASHGGIYFDTDMLLLQPMDPLLHTELLLGKESAAYISCGMIGAIPHHPFIEDMKTQYNTMSVLKPNPIIMTELYMKTKPKNTTVLPPHAFYPFDADTIRLYHGQTLDNDVYGVHLWNYSWGHPLNKLFKKIRIHKIGITIVEFLGINKIL